MSENTAEIFITGMTCGGCEKSVVNTITSVDGVDRAHADRHQNMAVVTWAAGLSPEARNQALQSICAKVEAAGFECRLAP